MKVNHLKPFDDLFKLSYKSEVDGHEDWALLEPGSNGLWTINLHGHGSQADQLYRRDDIKNLWLPKFRKNGTGILCPNLRGNAWMCPKAVSDLHELIGYLRLKYKPERILLFSGSMGATGCLIYSIIHPEDIDGVVALGGASDITTYYQWCLKHKHDNPIIQEISEAIKTAYGSDTKQNPGLFQKHSALTNSHKLSMPVFLCHGESDEIIPVNQSRALAEKLSGKSNFYYREIPLGDHDSPLSQIDSFDWIISQLT